MVDGKESEASYATIKKDLCAGGCAAPACSGDDAELSAGVCVV